MSIRVGEGACGDVVIVDRQVAHGDELCIAHRTAMCHWLSVGRDRDGLHRSKLRTTERADSTRRSVDTYTRMGIGEMAGFIAGWLILKAGPG
jgi:hypothetical protein